MPIRATSGNSVAQDIKRGELIQAVIRAGPPATCSSRRPESSCSFNRNPMRLGYTAAFQDC